MNVTNKTNNKTICKNTEDDNLSMVAGRLVERAENGNRRIGDELSLLDPIIFDPLRKKISYDSLETFRQLRLVCKTLSKLAFEFFDNDSKIQMAVYFRFEELYPKMNKQVKEKYQFVEENDLKMCILIKREDLKKFQKLELQENRNSKTELKMIRTPDTWLNGLVKKINLIRRFL